MLQEVTTSPVKVERTLDDATCVGRVLFIFTDFAVNFRPMFFITTVSRDWL